MLGKTGYWQKKLKTEFSSRDKIFKNSVNLRRENKLTNETNGKTKWNNLNDTIIKCRENWFKYLTHTIGSLFPRYMLSCKPTGKRSLGRSKKIYVSQLWGTATYESKMHEREEENQVHPEISGRCFLQSLSVCSCTHCYICSGHQILQLELFFQFC